jgi:hypothetical protein
MYEERCGVMLKVLCPELATTGKIITSFRRLIAVLSFSSFPVRLQFALKVRPTAI